jgi:hypothetical protein
MKREEQLAALFAIDIEFRAEMSNHLHIVLRTSPRAAQRLSAIEVARRWLMIARLAKCFTDDLPEVDQKMIQSLAKNKKRVAKLRRRLCKVSWFMGTLLENIARRANFEDDTTGKFWSARYGCRECTDSNSVLICGMYVDLNPILAGEANGPETAQYTSVFQRLQAASQPKNSKSRADGWLAELSLRPERKADEQLACMSRTGRRATDMGIIPVSLKDYVRLLKWTAEKIMSGERETIPRDLESVLDYLQVCPDAWVETVQDYEAMFCHAIGPPASLDEVARRLDVHHLKGAPAARRAFA